MVVFKREQSGLTNEGFSSEDIHGSVDSTMSAPDPSSANGKPSYPSFSMSLGKDNNNDTNLS